MTFSPYFHPEVGPDGSRLPVTVATKAALAALAALEPVRTPGYEVIVAADYSRWIFHPTSVAVDASQNAVVTPAAGAGAWLRVDKQIDLSMPFSFATADAATLFTVPAGTIMRVGRGYWDIDVALTGGTASAIGLSSSNAGFNTKGDLLGGASGDVAASLTAGRVKLGTIGAKTAAGVILVAGDTIRFDRITSAFTAGSGRARVIADLLQNIGA